MRDARLAANNAAVARLWPLWRRCGGRDCTQSLVRKRSTDEGTHVELAFGWVICSCATASPALLVCPRRNRIELDRLSPASSPTHHHCGRAPSPSIHQVVLALDAMLPLLELLPLPPPTTLMLARWRCTITCTGSTGPGLGPTVNMAGGNVTGVISSERRQTSRPSSCDRENLDTSPTPGSKALGGHLCLEAFLTATCTQRPTVPNRQPYGKRCSVSTWDEA
ncbi:hypothetical protein J3F83DRAFT_45944 [Trichoderma novae-zelandiae]